MTARQTKSVSYDVGYGKPPRHAQFRKGRSGNPGGRPRREPVERLKALTLQEAYRGVVIKREDGVGMPAFAIQAILRSQIELAMNGNVRAQRDILAAVRTYEREEAIGEAVDACAAERVRQAADLEERILAARRAAPAAEEKMNYHDAARRVAFLLGLGKQESETAQSETTQPEICAAGNETVTEEGEAEPSAAAPAPSVDRAPRPEDGTASAAPLLPSSRSGGVSPPPATKHSQLLDGRGAHDGEAPPLQSAAAPVVRPRPSRSRPVPPQPDRDVRRPARESAPPAGADSRSRRVHNKYLRRRTGHSAPPLNVTWKQLMSRHSERQKSGNSLLNSLFSGNAPTARSAPPGTPPQRWIGSIQTTLDGFPLTSNNFLNLRDIRTCPNTKGQYKWRSEWLEWHGKNQGRSAHVRASQRT